MEGSDPASSAGAAPDVGSVQILVKNPSDAPGTLAFKLSVALTRSVAELKEEIAAAYPGRPAVDHQRLIFSGKLLANEAKLTSVLAGFDTAEPQTFHLVISGAVLDRSGASSSRAPQPMPQAFSNPVLAATSASAASLGTSNAGSQAAVPQAPDFVGPPTNMPSGSTGPGGHASHQRPPGEHAQYPPAWAYGGGPGVPNPYGYLSGEFPPPPAAYGGGHYPFPAATYYQYPGAPQVPPPAEDGDYGGLPHGPPGGPPGGYAAPPYGAFNDMGPNYVAHLQAMHERFMHDLAAQQLMQEQPGDHGQARHAQAGMNFGFAPAGPAAAGAGGGGGAGAPGANAGVAGGVAVAAGGGGNGPRVRHYVFQLDLNWSLISKLIFLVVLFGQEGSSQRMYALAGAAALVYLWHTGRLGVLQRIIATLLPTPTQLFETVVPPAARAGEGVAERREINRFAVTLSYAYSFLYGFVCSLLPSWEPVQLPNMDEVFNPENNVNVDEEPVPQAAVAGVDGDHQHAE